LTTRNHGNNNYRHCRFFVIILFVFLIPGILSAQEELTFVAVRDTVALRLTDDIDADTSMDINAGDLIRANAVITFSPLRRRADGWPDDWHLEIRLASPHNWYSVPAKDFRAANTEDVFGADIFIDYPPDREDPSIGQPNENPLAIGDTDAMWVPFFYRDVLSSQDRDLVLYFQPDLFAFQHSIHTTLYTWYGHIQANIRNGRAMFYDSAIMLGIGTHLAVRNIKKTDFGYLVESIVSEWDNDRRWRGAFLHGSEFWARYRPGQAVTLLLYIDGEYLDIYTSSGIHVATYIRVGREFIAQYQNLIRTNTSDLTNVQWPSRADGSTGVRPRPEPSPAQPVVDDDAEEPVEIPAADIAGDIPEQEIVVAQDITDATPPLPWALPAVIAGAVIIAGGAVLVVAKRKRTQS